MKERRYFICLLGAGILLYYALPNLPINDGKLGQIFTIAWLTLCMFVIAGNLGALLFAPKNAAKKETIFRPQKKKMRYFD